MDKINFEPGQQIYKYSLQKLIGRGEFSQVWLATDHSVKKDIALKILNPSNSSITDKLKEAVVGNRMNHENLVRVHYADVVIFNDSEVVLLAMDYQKNGCITKNVNCLKYVKLNSAIKSIIEILRGLDYLHQEGVLHNDIKPNNIMIGDNEECLLSDYGISARVTENEYIQSRYNYHPHMSPESYNLGLVNTKTDIYQVGLTLFRLINGVNLISELFNKYKPNEYKELVISGKIINDNDWKLFIPNSLRRIVKKAVQVNSSDRYNTALEMRRDLEKLNFKGYWELTTDNNFVGNLKNNIYSYSVESRNSQNVDFLAYRTNRKSSRKTKVSKFCNYNIKSSKLVKVKKKFMTAVVEGNL